MIKLIACSTRIRQKYLSVLKATDNDNSSEDNIILSKFLEM